MAAAASSPERFVRAALAALPGADGRARRRARARSGPALEAGAREGGRAVQALLGRWAALDTVEGRPVALLLDEVTEIRSLAYFSGLREVDEPFGAALAARPRGHDAGHVVPRVARRLWPADGHPRDAPALRGRAAERSAHARAARGRIGARRAPPSDGRATCAILLDACEQAHGRLATPGRSEMALGRTARAGLPAHLRGAAAAQPRIRHVQGRAGRGGRGGGAEPHRARGRVSAALRARSATTSDGCSRVDALRTARKRYYYVDGVLRLWVRLHARG